MKRTRILVLTLILAAWAAPAAAACVANGTRYATGTVLGNYQCQPSGEWKRVSRR